MNINFSKISLLFPILLALEISHTIQANIVSKSYRLFHKMQAERFVKQALTANNLQKPIRIAFADEKEFPE